MGTNDNTSDIARRLRDTYSLENALIEQIITNFNEMYKNVFPNVGEYNIENIEFKVLRSGETGEYELSGSHEALIFLGSICKTLTNVLETILQSTEFRQQIQNTANTSIRRYIEKFIIPLREESFKRCSKCNYENRSNAVYCNSCGRKM
jgi:hypothetical protein